MLGLADLLPSRWPLWRRFRYSSLLLSQTVPGNPPKRTSHPMRWSSGVVGRIVIPLLNQGLVWHATGSRSTFLPFLLVRRTHNQYPLVESLHGKGEAAFSYVFFVRAVFPTVNVLGSDWTSCSAIFLADTRQYIQDFNWRYLPCELSDGLFKDPLPPM